ncbi:hemolysin activation/secretion protein [Leptothrix ochracea L12]|uniref:Hemolysin activation/secretion protein n=1 Tax=Leptothrix ochracea L12 TaxID=735332 RepID=I4Z5V4_9BURK|nr:POTRA domain-containing protein [Leptothrix ochracea]EIM31596.1 hemolysin activation/secretion protein [Leptothrix ochracea L12]
MTHKPFIHRHFTPANSIYVLLFGVLLGSGPAQAFSNADLLRLKPPLQPEAAWSVTEATVNRETLPPPVQQPTIHSETTVSAKTIHVAGFRVHGNTRFPENELVALLDDSVGRDLNFNQLQALAARLSEFYHRQGYDAAQAYLPIQQVRGGIIEFAVSEGQVGNINVVTPQPEDVATLRSYLHMQTGDPLRLDVLEQHRLTLSELPGVRSQIVLAPSQEPGRTDLSLHAQREPSLVGRVELNNVPLLPGTSGQADATLNWRHVGSLGTGLTTRLTALGQGNFRSQATLTHQTEGWQAGLDLAYLEYSLSPHSSLLNLDFPNSVEHGHAAMVAAEVSTTLIRQPGRFGKISARLEHRNYHNQLEFIVDDRDMDSFTLGWSERRQSLGQQQNFEGTATAGRVSDMESFMLVTSRWALATRMDAHWQANTRADAQWADKALPRSEQLRLGGPQAVRAYDSSDARVDTGLVAGAELRRTGQIIDGFIFGDVGWGVLNQAPGSSYTDHWFNRESLGVGFELHPLPKTQLMAQVSWQTIDTRPRLWLNLTQAF